MVKTGKGAAARERNTNAVKRVLKALLLLAAIYLLAPKGHIVDAYRRYVGRLQIEAPGGCLEVAIGRDTSFNDHSGDTDLGFSINRVPAYGPIKWKFIARTRDTPESQFGFSLRKLPDASPMMHGQGCYMLGGSGRLKHVAREVPGQPEVPYEECSIHQHRLEPTYMLFNPQGDTVARVRCTWPDRLYCSARVEIDGAIFRLGMWENDLEKLEAIRTQMQRIIRENMTFKSECSLW